MPIQKISLRNFRNIQEAVFEPAAHINFLVGQNAQGKTSILEALGFLANLYSFRDCTPQELVTWQHQQSQISCDLTFEGNQTGDWQGQLKVEFFASAHDPKKFKKLASVNGKNINSTVQYISQRFNPSGLGFHAIVFNPSDHELVQGQPSRRRDYLNQVLASESLGYLKTLKAYKRVLEQRNKLLRGIRDGNAVPQAEAILEHFTQLLIEYGSQLLLERLQWVEKMSQKLAENLWGIAPKQAHLRLAYSSSLLQKNGEKINHHHKLKGLHFAGQGPLPPLEVIHQAFQKRLSELHIAERSLGSTLLGPHRDDWHLFLGNELLKGHGSQGEVRSSLLALKLAEIDHYRQITGLAPVLLLDDFSSELDRYRRQKLLQLVLDLELQIFVTATEGLSALGLKTGEMKGKQFHVEDGRVSEELYSPETGTVSNAKYDDADTSGRIFS